MTGTLVPGGFPETDWTAGFLLPLGLCNGSPCVRTGGLYSLCIQARFSPRGMKRSTLCLWVIWLPVLKHGPRSSLSVQVRPHDAAMGVGLKPLSTSYPGVKRPLAVGVELRPETISGDSLPSVVRALLRRPPGFLRGCLRKGSSGSVELRA